METMVSRVSSPGVWKRARRSANPGMNYLIHCLYAGWAIIIELNARLRRRKAFHASACCVSGLMSTVADVAKYRAYRKHLSTLYRHCIISSAGFLQCLNMN